MTKKDYIKWAALFRVVRPNSQLNAKEHVEQHNYILVAALELFKSDNPRFDDQRFLEAAGGWAK